MPAHGQKGKGKRRRKADKPYDRPKVGVSFDPLHVFSVNITILAHLAVTTTLTLCTHHIVRRRCLRLASCSSVSLKYASPFSLNQNGADAKIPPDLVVFV